jgi:hypothetical protein
MSRFSVMLFAAALSASLQAQNMPAGPAAEIKQGYNAVKGNIIAAAEQMPEENYSFAPAKEEMTFGQWVGHIADSQMGACSRLNGEQKNLGAAQKTSKADLEAALKASFDECDKSYNSLTDGNGGDMVTTGRGQRSRIGTLAGNTAHINECYGSMAVYMRAKGLVPPSTANRGRGMGGKKQ